MCKGRCKNCEYFETLFLAMDGFGDCENITQKSAITNNNLNKAKKYMFADDYLKLYGEFETSISVGEDFGCIHFKKRSKNNER